MSATDKVFVNGSLPDIDDVDLNGFNDENINLIVGSNQIATAADKEQTHKAVARYASYGNVLVASGTGDAIVLSLVGNNIMPATSSGMEVRWQSLADNTGPTTLNVPGIGILDLRDSVGGVLVAGAVLNNTFYAAVFNAVANQWWLVNPVRTAITIQTFTTAGAATWTKPAGVTQVIIEAIGGGGGGGSADVSLTGGGGGGAAGYVKIAFDVTTIASLALTIGAAGAGGAAAGLASSGFDGSDTTVTGTGISLTGSAGFGGLAGGLIAGGIKGRGGAAAGGDLNIRGGDGNSSSFTTAQGSVGGASFFGGGGQGGNQNNAGGSSAVNGSGGGGGSSLNSDGNALAGAPGTVGLVTITEYR